MPYSRAAALGSPSERTRNNPVCTTLSYDANDDKPENGFGASPNHPDKAGFPQLQPLLNQNGISRNSLSTSQKQQVSAKQPPSTTAETQFLTLVRPDASALFLLIPTAALNPSEILMGLLHLLNQMRFSKIHRFGAWRDHYGLFKLMHHAGCKSHQVLPA